MESDTQRIARGLRRGDIAVLESLVEQYQFRLVRYLVSLLGRREGVDDFVQETWLRVLERGHSYDGRSRFEPWLFRVARNVAIDAMRKRPMLSLDASEDSAFRSTPASSEPSPYTLAARTQDAERLGHSLQTLEHVYREALVLRFQEDLSLQEISAIVGAPGLYRSFENLSRIGNAADAVHGRCSMILDHQVFQRGIDGSLAGALSAEEEQSLRQHLATCPSCCEYLSASNRAIASLGGFSFQVDPTLNARVMAALRLRAEEGRRVLVRPHKQAQRHSVPLKNWAAFAVALSLSFAGSGFVYQMAERLAVPTHYVSAQLQAEIVVFWLLPSLCAAFCLLAAPREKGIA